MRLHITGASGSGTTTLAAALSDRFGWRHIDTDTYYWLPTDPPFQRPRPVPERLAMLEADLAAAGSWVLSGAIGDWGNPLIPLFDFVIFLAVQHETRMARLRAREVERYGDAIQPGGRMHDTHIAFLEWAAQYEDGDLTLRSRRRHEAWLATIPCPILRIEGEHSVEERVDIVSEALDCSERETH